VSDKLAMMAVEIHIARQLTYFAGRAKDEGRRCDLEAGMAKLLAARVAWAAADNALQIHGGNGFALEYPISRVPVRRPHPLDLRGRRPRSRPRSSRGGCSSSNKAGRGRYLVIFTDTGRSSGRSLPRLVELLSRLFLEFSGSLSSVLQPFLLETVTLIRGLVLLRVVLVHRLSSVLSRPGAASKRQRTNRPSASRPSAGWPEKRGACRSGSPGAKA
jgi:hypothetical protein